MAKKSRRARKKSSRNVSQAAVQAAAAAQGAVAAAEPADDRHEYAYVVADLRQVVILAAAMFALLVGLSFVIS